jgi:hypothetical protein
MNVTSFNGQEQNLAAGCSARAKDDFDAGITIFFYHSRLLMFIKILTPSQLYLRLHRSMITSSDPNLLRSEKCPENFFCWYY